MSDVEKVKQICKERKIPISKMEKDLGFSNGYIGQLKKGYFPSDRAAKISKYLGISLSSVDDSTVINSDDIAKDDAERTLLVLCRNATASEEEKEAIVNMFKSTIDIYKKARGIE